MLTRRPLAGKVFKIGEDRASTPPKMEVHASFGGLLMLLKARALRHQRSSIALPTKLTVSRVRRASPAR